MRRRDLGWGRGRGGAPPVFFQPPSCDWLRSWLHCNVFLVPASFRFRNASCPWVAAQLYVSGARQLTSSRGQPPSRNLRLEPPLEMRLLFHASKLHGGRRCNHCLNSHKHTSDIVHFTAWRPFLPAHEIERIYQIGPCLCRKYIVKMNKFFSASWHSNAVAFVHAAYGLTETTSIVTTVPCDLTAENCRAKSGSVGVPLYNVQMKVIIISFIYLLLLLLLYHTVWLGDGWNG